MSHQPQKFSQARRHHSQAPGTRGHLPEEASREEVRSTSHEPRSGNAVEMEEAKLGEELEKHDTEGNDPPPHEPTD